MENEKIKMVRLNTAITKEQSDWYETTAKYKGMFKKHLVMIALEKYMIEESDRIEKLNKINETNV